MSIKSIGSIVNTGFIQSFQGLAGSGGPAIGAGAGQAATVYSGLRLGARTFATSIQSLNSAIGVVNLAEGALKKLSEVVDGMIGLAEKATASSAATETRRKLQSDFEDLVEDFRDIVAGSKLNDIEILTEEGLATLFQRVGLDKESSTGVAAVLSKFVKPDTEDSFASEETKATRPVNVPVLKKSRAEQISNSNLVVNGSGISAEYNVYTDTNTYGFRQIFAVDTAGVTTIDHEIGVTEDQQVLAVNETKGNSGETTGYAIIKSSQDLTSENPLGYEQLFLVSPTGSVVRQISDVDANFDFTNTSIDISADNKTVALSYIYDGDATVAVVSVSDIASSPSTLTFDEILYTPADVVKMSNDAQHFAYKDGGDLVIKQVGGATDSYLVGVHDVQDFGFADSDTIIFSNSLGEVYSYDFNSSSENLILVDPDMTKLTVLENDSTFTDNDGSPANTPQNAAIAYVTATSTGNRVTVSNFDLNSETLKTRFRRDLGEGTVDEISLAFQNDGNRSKDRIDLGVKGNLPALFGDSDTELYRLNETKFATNSSLFSQASADPANILDGNLYTRADAYRMLADLRALKSQIGDNLEALDDTRNYIGSNIEFIRTAGYAFLDISNQLTGTEEADKVAKMVASEIRRNSTQAQAAQVENLSTIVSQTTALLSSSS